MPTPLVFIVSSYRLQTSIQATDDRDDILCRIQELSKSSESKLDRFQSSIENKIHEVEGEIERAQAAIVSKTEFMVNRSQTALESRLNTLFNTQLGKIKSLHRETQIALAGQQPIISLAEISRRLAAVESLVVPFPPTPRVFPAERSPSLGKRERDDSDSEESVERGRRRYRRMVTPPTSSSPAKRQHVETSSPCRPTRVLRPRTPRK